MDMAGVFDEGDEAVLSMFGAGWCLSAAIIAIDRREAWWAVILVSLGAFNLWHALG